MLTVSFSILSIVNPLVYEYLFVKLWESSLQLNED